jgi:hypothetical protein
MLLTRDDPFRVLADYKRNAMCQLIPRRLLAKANFSSPANRFLCAPDHAVPLRSEVVTGVISAETAAAHLIPAEATAAALEADWDGFIAARLEAMAAVESTFVNEIVDRNPGLLSSGAKDTEELLPTESDQGVQRF